MRSSLDPLSFHREHVHAGGQSLRQWSAGRSLDLVGGEFCFSLSGSHKMVVSQTGVLLELCVSCDFDPYAGGLLGLLHVQADVRCHASTDKWTYSARQGLPLKLSSENNSGI